MKKSLIFAICACAMLSISQVFAVEVVKTEEVVTVTPVQTRGGKTVDVVEVQDIVEVEPSDSDAWTFFQLGFFPRVPSYTYNSNVYGFKTGWPMSSGIGIVRGFEASWLFSGTDNVEGMQATLICSAAEKVIGVQAANIVSLNKGFVRGVQAAPLLAIGGDIVGLQCGGLNIARSIEGFQPGVFGNISREVEGFQAGLFNISKKLVGAQAAPVFNYAKDSEDGFQIGLVNVSSKKGLQFGLINIIKGGPLPVMILFNIDL